MTVTAKITKHTYDAKYHRLPDTTFFVTAETQDKLLATFFREYDNRYKYCNDISHSFEDKTMQDLYRTWISDVNNYANNGGDMW